MGIPAATTSITRSNVTAVTSPLHPGAGVPPWWEPLFLASPNRSVFLSVAWMQSWLEVYERDFLGLWIRWVHEEQTVGGCLLLSRVTWKGFVPMRSMFLNATGEAVERTPLAEFNDILHLPGYDQPIAIDLARMIRQMPWSRLMVSGYPERSLLTQLIPLLPAALIEHDPRPAPYVDLDALSKSNSSFEAALTGKDGSQIRRNTRRYEEKYGPFQVRPASSLKQALAFFNEMSMLHRASWESKGQRGSFSSTAVIHFHRNLISRLWPSQGVDLLCVANDQRISGYLYNFTSEGKVYYFQSGFAYRDDCKLSPGLFTHSLAIEHYRQHGLSEYDFLAGDMRYKRSLAKQARILRWTVIYRDQAWTRLILWLRAKRAMLLARVRKGAEAEGLS